MIKSLLLKDWYNIKKFKILKISIIMILILVTIFTFMLGKEASSRIIVIILLSFSSILYQQDEKENIVEYLKSLPIKEKDIVKEKFVLNGILAIISFLIINVFYGMLYLVGQNIVLEDIIVSLITILSIYSIYSIYIPLIYKTSTRKAPMIIFIIVFGIIFAVGIFSKILKGSTLSGASVERFSDINIFLIILVSSLIINIISYFSAIKILKNKDF